MAMSRKWTAAVVSIVAVGWVAAGCGVRTASSPPPASLPAATSTPSARPITAYPPFAGRIGICSATRQSQAQRRWHLAVTVCWDGSLHGSPIAFFGSQLGDPVWIWTKGNRSRLYRTGYPPTIYQFSGNYVCLGSYEADWAMAVNLQTGQLINPLDGPRTARQWRTVCASTSQAHSAIVGVPGSG